MKQLGLAFMVLTTVACSGLQNTSSISASSTQVTSEHPESRPYDIAPDVPAQVQVEDALVIAADTGKHAIIVMGANWCHDSRALAGWFDTARFQTLLDDKYVVKYIDVGQKDLNIDIAQRFGLKEIVGTPTVFVTNSEGGVLNLETAPTWRNAASRDEEAIFNYFDELAPKPTQ